MTDNHESQNGNVINIHHLADGWYLADGEQREGPYAHSVAIGRATELAQRMRHRNKPPARIRVYNENGEPEHEWIYGDAVFTFPAAPAFQWVWRARPGQDSRGETNHDGDTITVIIDRGFKETQTMTLRLLGVNAPELNSSDANVRQRALQAKQFVADWLAQRAASGNPWPLLLTSYRLDIPIAPDKYGDRFDAVVYDTRGFCLNTDLLASGNAVNYPITLER
jgi:hypothetical protein